MHRIHWLNLPCPGLDSDWHWCIDRQHYYERWHYCLYFIPKIAAAQCPHSTSLWWWNSGPMINYLSLTNLWQRQQNQQHCNNKRLSNCLSKSGKFKDSTKTTYILTNNQKSSTIILHQCVQNKTRQIRNKNHKVLRIKQVSPLNRNIWNNEWNSDTKHFYFRFFF